MNFKNEKEILSDKNFNPQIIEYWKNIFSLAGKPLLRERELVDAMLAYHQKEDTPVNVTKCLGKIFKDKYRGYLVLMVDKNKNYSINSQFLQKNKGVNNESE